MVIKNVEEYLIKHQAWEQELILLREILLSTDLKETIKWGTPVYTINGKNLVGIAAFKNHCALWFYNGALLKKNTELLHNAQEGKTKALRQIRFKKDEAIKADILLNYIEEAIQIQLEGKEIKASKNKPLIIPSELKKELKNNPKLKSAFHNLGKGKQRDYAEYISEAKRESTKQTRLERIIPMILEGKGLNDKYKNS